MFIKWLPFILIGSALAIFGMKGLATARADDAQIRAVDAAEIVAMRANIGKTFWVQKPHGKGIELCPAARDRFNECVYFANTSLRVTAVDAGQEYFGIHAMKMYGVTLADGRRGCVSGGMKVFLLPYDPVAKRNSDIEECTRRGEPKVGMNRLDVEATCWGRPRAVQKITTAGGITEHLIYSNQRRIEVVNGAVSAIIEREQ